jgi:phospholipase C
VTRAPAGEHPDFQTTGVRVPAIIVSPLVTAGAVYSQVLDHTSILKLIARKFSDGHYSSEVDGRSVGNVADALDLAQPRTDIPQAPDPSVIPTPQGSAAPPPSTNNNVKAFTAAAQQMRRQYAYQLAAKFPEQRKIILGH